MNKISFVLSSGRLTTSIPDICVRRTDTCHDSILFRCGQMHLCKIGITTLRESHQLPWIHSGPKQRDNAAVECPHQSSKRDRLGGKPGRSLRIKKGRQNMFAMAVEACVQKTETAKTSKTPLKSDNESHLFCTYKWPTHN